MAFSVIRLHNNLFRFSTSFVVSFGGYFARISWLSTRFPLPENYTKHILIVIWLYSRSIYKYVSFLSLFPYSWKNSLLCKFAKKELIFLTPSTYFCICSIKYQIFIFINIFPPLYSLSLYFFLGCGFQKAFSIPPRKVKLLAVSLLSPSSQSPGKHADPFGHIRTFLGEHRRGITIFLSTTVPHSLSDPLTGWWLRSWNFRASCDVSFYLSPLYLLSRARICHY